MKEVVVYTTLIVGVACVAAQILIFVIVAMRTPDTKGVGELDATQANLLEKILDILKGLSEKAPLLVGGILLILISAIFSGIISASLEIG